MMTDHTENAYAAYAQAETQIEQAMNALTAAHPHWPQYEQVMLQYAQQLPNGALDAVTYPFNC